MGDLSVIDEFLAAFSLYIDSGFGLLSTDIAFLTSFLIALDITLAGLFWAMSENTNVIAQLIKKTLYIGFFAFLIGNFAFLSGVIFDSFAGLGLKAGGSTLTSADLLRPGFIAAAGYDAATPLLEEMSSLLGPIAFFENFATIAVLFFAWVVVLLSFFVLAVQLFISILEFKLTTLAGFVLVPFALWNKTSFLAERVLGHVMTSGIKLMVLAIIVGIGSTVFGTMTAAFAGGDITLEQALSMVLASVALFGLGIFGPGVAAGLIAGAPQLGAGAAVGAVGGLAAGAYLGGAAAIGGVRAAASGAASAVRSGASLSGGGRAAYDMAKLGSGREGAGGAFAGLAGVARAGLDSVSRAAARPFSGISAAYAQGAAQAFNVTGGKVGGRPISSEGGSPAGAPEWAKRIASRERLHVAAGATAHALRDGDRGGAGEAPRLNEPEERS